MDMPFPTGKGTCLHIGHTVAIVLSSAKFASLQNDSLSLNNKLSLIKVCLRVHGWRRGMCSHHRLRGQILRGNLSGGLRRRGIIWVLGRWWHEGVTSHSGRQIAHKPSRGEISHATSIAPWKTRRWVSSHRRVATSSRKVSTHFWVPGIAGGLLLRVALGRMARIDRSGCGFAGVLSSSLALFLLLFCLIIRKILMFFWYFCIVPP